MMAMCTKYCSLFSKVYNDQKIMKVISIFTSMEKDKQNLNLTFEIDCVSVL